MLATVDGGGVRGLRRPQHRHHLSFLAFVVLHRLRRLHALARHAVVSPRRARRGGGASGKPWGARAGALSVAVSGDRVLGRDCRVVLLWPAGRPATGAAKCAAGAGTTRSSTAAAPTAAPRPRRSGGTALADQGSSPATLALAVAVLYLCSSLRGFADVRRVADIAAVVRFSAVAVQRVRDQVQEGGAARGGDDDDGRRRRRMRLHHRAAWTRVDRGQGGARRDDVRRGDVTVRRRRRRRRGRERGVSRLAAQRRPTGGDGDGVLGVAGAS